MGNWQEPELTIHILSETGDLTVSGTPDPGDEGTPWV